MSNWSNYAGSRLETIQGGTPGQGTVINCPIIGGQNTKGSYSVFGSATFDWDGFYLDSTGTVGIAKYFIDFAISTAGGPNTIIFPDLFIDAATRATSSGSLCIPIRIPKGSSLMGRGQSNFASATTNATITGYAGDFNKVPPLSRGEAASILTSSNTTIGTVITQTSTAMTAWTVLCTATQSAWKGFFLVGSRADDITRTACSFVFDVGVGASGSERAIITSVLGAQNANDVLSVYFGPFYATIPVSSQLSLRIACGGNAKDSIAFALYGLV